RTLRGADETERQLNTELARVARNASATPAPRLIGLDDTELETWFERDRAHVALVDKHSGETIVEWWDDDVQQAIDDGFLPHRWSDTKAHEAAFDYAKQVGVIADEPRNGRGPYYVRMPDTDLYFRVVRDNGGRSVLVVPLSDAARDAIADHEVYAVTMPDG